LVDEGHQEKRVQNQEAEFTAYGRDLAPPARL
jgi:hypothetical protein